MLEQLLGTANPKADDFSRAAALPQGNINIVITATGEWLYNGTPFKRHRMVNMLAGKLFTQDGEYYLLAPEQRLKIQVEDLPFAVVGVNQSERAGVPVIAATTNCDEELVVDAEHPLVLLPRNNLTSTELLPAVLVREGLYARFSRAAYYHLVNWAEPAPESANSLNGNELIIRSAGQSFVIGQY